jgi:pimeloyl-ACP methyl ester carboxylesterase
VATFTQELVSGTGSGPAARHRPPSTYVRCSDDRCVPLSHQDAMAAGCDTVLTLNSDHCPMLSVPVELAAILASVATGG